ncbi:HAD family hydrolase [Tellurirhabdus rosea]|uniref:HAD family hydrolase n=1 Tax=Tellurirhabdus rosea TaxID=2674997 RepID=UPI0022539FAA|nr:HAD family phosphatase [Tellurirhabdus rosea]
MSGFSFAALFDMDGVLVDNLNYHVQAWRTFAHHHGRTLTLEDYFRHVNGRVAADALPFVLGRDLSRDEIVAFTEEKEATYRQLYGPDLQPTPGLIPFLQTLKTSGTGLAVGTSAPFSNIGFTLDGLRIRSYFDAVVDASMISRGKPDPEIYLQAAERLGVPPSRCVVFEDAYSGIEAGLRAGMKVVALATTHTPGELAGCGAHHIIPNFEAGLERGLHRLDNWL